MNSALSQLRGEIASALDGLDAAQTQLRPPSLAGKWTIQQIIEHLLLTYSLTCAALDARIAKGRPTQAKPSLSQYLAQYTIIRLGYFPARRKAPPMVTPPTSSQPLSGAELAHAAAELLSHLDNRCTAAVEIFGPIQRCANHMSLGPLSIEDWQKFQTVHGAHHLKQIAAIRRSWNIQPQPAPRTAPDNSLS